MKKNGFIATSLIYSFFLVFCAVLLSFITISSHNKNLLDKANEDIRNDLLAKKLKDVSIGSFVKVDINHPEFNVDVNWILFDKEDNALLVSDANVISYKAVSATAVASRLVRTMIDSFTCSCETFSARVLNASDLILFNNNADSKYIVNRLMNVSPLYYVKLSDDFGERTLYEFPTINNDNLTLEDYKSQVFSTSNYKYHNSGDDVNFRIVIILDKEDAIFGGNGSKNNPYYISC